LLSLHDVVFICIITPLAASAQIDVPAIKRWSEKECIWLHRQALDECKENGRGFEGTKLCSQDDFSMSTNRGLSAFDSFWTVRNREQFDAICLRVCEENAKPTYSQFRKEFCSKVRRQSK
jgi:hypothetical protein